MKAFTKREKTTIANYLNRIVGVVTKRKIELETIREIGTKGMEASIALDELLIIENNLNEFSEGFLNDRNEEKEQDNDEAMCRPVLRLRQACI
jgi:DNA integrity scanning protein DisA with diadenylate cyclase activity